MALKFPNPSNPFLLSSSPLTPSLQNPNFFTLHFSNHRRKLKLRASSTADPNGADGSSWSESLDRASRRFLVKFGDMVKKETGVDLGDGVGKVGEFVDGVRKVGSELRIPSLDEFVDWNRFENWKNVKNWEPRRIGALVLYIFVVAFACRGVFVAIQAPFLNHQRKESTEAYMEVLIPAPTPTNIRKFKKVVWRKTMPKGLKIKKFIERPDGTLVHDSTFVGEDAWENDQESSDEHVKQIVGDEERLNSEEKNELTKDLAISGEVQTEGTWRERLHKWREILGKERLVEQLNSLNAKYEVDFDMKEVENSLRKEVVEKVRTTQGTRALWIAKRWWRYRPKLPYNYFLDKLDSSEVEAVIFTEDMKRLYVTMKEGFPLEYVVDIPLDPYLFEIISSSGVEVDLLQKQQIHYFLKVAIAFLPGILILILMKQSLAILHLTSSRFLYKKYNQLFDMAYAENFILPVGDVGETKSMSKEVVLGGDVWDLLDELMIYMRNPMQFYERDVKFVRGVLLSGPPGTGKTLFARTLAKQSGLPFVFASGAEFTDSEKSGAAKINKMFSLARRNAPCFVFVDEIDAIAGRHTRKDPRRKATFEALITQLDGEKEKTGIDRVSLRQAVIFICATNRADELDLDFVRPGRIDRRLYIGLPDAEQRIKIFDVHSSGKQLGEDVNFTKLVFRTVGFSGADIRNLVNEAAIMSVRNGHPKIFQQDITDVLDKQLLEGMGVLITEDEQKKSEERVSFEKKRLLAVHEAGHIVLAHLFPRFDLHAFSQLLPGGKETAISVFNPREDMVDQGYTTFGYLKMQMVVAHGGRCAEHVIFGEDITDGGRDDLEKITKIAREMVISPQNKRLGLIGLTKRVGLADQPDASDDDLIKYRWDDPQVVPTKMSVELSELFTRELTRYIEETEELAMNALRDNKHIVDMVARELLEKSRITGFEVEEKMKQLSPVMFDDFVKPFQVDCEEDGPLPHNDDIHYRTADLYPAPLHRC
ncbi:putative peptidase M41, ATPase, AAA-type, core, P-loop containing nucleoside triphosphate hydrolase [Medicago truncatula]|uniref:ATP-dependent zinc metalloprotease FTSH protein n=1 Tax=Medicago truncatula TaxID=3880 RepID=G7LB10_MEDTR|nr:ATP-dependent zinc metalloprotease FTSH 12, chloroplastic isoform X2 [Medicago truncatula]AET02875.1 ATP-dependent zinc metalloprotease FTSH protein [Medicago truncatula]RHN40670.1 putative peptidase M41, ATPase, AAA-type, core, P-loop containing nucleoside triphosphate hydrolase [Medicago truncatula]